MKLAPLILLQILHALQELSHKQGNTMSAISDGLAAVNATLDKLAIDNDKAFTDLKAAIANGSNPADVQAAIDGLAAINTRLQSLDAAAIAADSAPAPAPAPVPDPTPAP